MVPRFHALVLHSRRPRRTLVEMIPAAGGASRAVITGASQISDVQFAPDGKTMVYAEQSGDRPHTTLPCVIRWRRSRFPRQS